MYENLTLRTLQFFGLCFSDIIKETWYIKKKLHKEGLTRNILYLFMNKEVKRFDVIGFNLIVNKINYSISVNKKQSLYAGDSAL